MPTRTLAATLLPMVLLAGCADAAPVEPDTTNDPGTRYVANATVLEDASHGPELCVGVIADSLPPQCAGVPLAGWDWQEAEGEESVSGTTWGEFRVVGTYDGTTMTVLEVGPYEAPPPERDRDWTTCPEPAGGWVATEPSRAAMEDVEAVGRAIRDLEAYAGHWVDYVEEPTEFVEPGGIILNVAFTQDLDANTDVVRELWGGPLCVVRHERSYNELRRIQRELGERVGAELGLQTTWSDGDILENVVTMGVVLADEQAQRALDERYGEGVVRLVPALEPLT